MRQRLGILIVFVLSWAWADPSFSQSEAAHVVFSLKEWTHWASVLGADSPAFTLYDDRNLVYFNVDAGRYECVRLSEDQHERLCEEIVPRDLASLENSYDRVAVSCQNEYFFYFAGAPGRIVSVYGHPTDDYGAKHDEMTNDDWVFEIPQSLRRCFTAVTDYRNCQATRWLPDQIEVVVWEMWPTNKQYMEWPADWPSLDSSDAASTTATSSIFLDKDLYDEFLTLLDESQGVVMMDGKPMCIWYRLPIPGEEIFAHVFDYEQEESDEGNTALHNAALWGKLDEVKTLVEAGADVNAKNNEGVTPLHYAACRDKEDIVEFLLANGADVNAADNDAWTPLHWAVYNDCVDTIQTLLEAGADTEARTTGGRTALLEAIEWEFTGVVELLLAGGADAEAKVAGGNTALLYAIDLREADVADVLLDNGVDAAAISTIGDTALHYATDDVLTDIVTRLIAEGLDINARNDANDFPLYGAALDGATQIVRLLLDKGADVNAAKPDGRTALHAAASRGHAEIVSLLIAGGADINAVTSEGRTPLDFAMMNCRDNAAETLRTAGAQSGGGVVCTSLADSAP